MRGRAVCQGPATLTCCEHREICVQYCCYWQGLFWASQHYHVMPKNDMRVISCQGQSFGYYCCTLAACSCSVCDFQNETCIFFFCRQLRYFWANYDLRSKKSFLPVVENISGFIMNCVQRLKRAVYKYA